MIDDELELILLDDIANDDKAFNLITIKTF